MKKFSILGLVVSFALIMFMAAPAIAQCGGGSSTGDADVCVCTYNFQAQGLVVGVDIGPIAYENPYGDTFSWDGMKVDLAAGQIQGRRVEMEAYASSTAKKPGSFSLSGAGFLAVDAQRLTFSGGGIDVTMTQVSVVGAGAFSTSSRDYRHNGCDY